MDDGLNAVLAVDLSTGARTIVSNNSTPDATNALSAPQDLVLDSANNRALVVDPVYGELLFRRQRVTGIACGNATSTGIG